MLRRDRIRKRYIRSMLPDWVNLVGSSGDFQVSSTFEFQLEWERTFSKIWSALTVEQRRCITPIHPPYTQESVVRFVRQIREATQGDVRKTSALKPSADTQDESFPILALQEQQTLNLLQEGTHPVLYSWLIEVFPDSFWMGASDEMSANADERPRHLVTLKRPFMLGMYPVNRALWRQVMDHSVLSAEDNLRPVANVSWLDCIRFCNRLSDLEGLERVYMIVNGEILCDFEAGGFRLPTEAEWEYAASGGRSTAGDCTDKYWFMNDEAALSIDHHSNNTISNPFGLVNMMGAFWEWCWDIHGPYVSVEQSDPSGPTRGTLRTCRGGSFEFDTVNHRITVRGKASPNRKSERVGFRLCRTLSC